ncbi:MAG: hypothetical protein U0235_15255 [Polyangiaceae bacterium]
MVTNFHVVQKAQSLRSPSSAGLAARASSAWSRGRAHRGPRGQRAPAELLKPIHVPQSLVLGVGQKTVAIGAPFGLDHHALQACIWRLGQRGIGGVTIRDVVQTDAAVIPAARGGPLLNSAGQLVE